MYSLLCLQRVWREKETRIAGPSTMKRSVQTHFMLWLVTLLTVVLADGVK